MEKKRSLIIITILVIIILALGGYILYDKVSGNSDDNNVKESYDNNEDNNLSESDNSLNKERPYLEGQIKKYYYDEYYDEEIADTYEFWLANDKISNFYIGGTIREYADMVVQDGKINVTTYVKEINSQNSGKDTSYISRNHIIEINGEKIIKIASRANSNLTASYLFVLTESRNVYASVYDNFGGEVIGFDKISNLKKLDVENVVEFIYMYRKSSHMGGSITIYAFDYRNYIDILNLAN